MIFNNEELQNKDRMRFYLLSKALEAKSKDEAWKIMNMASILFHSSNDNVFNNLYGAVAMEITRCNDLNEFKYHKLFKQVYNKLNKGVIVNRKNNTTDIPDAWVKRDNEYIPVEIKKYKFDNKALEQLNRYINTYKCKYGIAVAQELSVPLPNNIEFISIDELKKIKDN